MNSSLGCSQSSWGCSLPRVSFPGHVDWRTRSALPFLSSLIQLFHMFALKGKMAQWSWRSPRSVSHRFIVPACCFLFWILSSQALQGVFLRSCAFILRFLKRLGFFMCGGSGQQNEIMARFTFPNRSHQSASHNGWNWAVLLPKTLFSLWLMAQGY